MRLQAWAKINLGLEVDAVDILGYHPIRTLMAEISLADQLSIEPAPAWQLEISGESSDGVGDPEDNLVWRAEQLVQVLTSGGAPEDQDRSWRVRLAKRIPVGAGLGGGSADAAAWLRHRTDGMPKAAPAVWSAASRLGTDIPFFRLGGIQFADGYGEHLRPIAAGQFRPFVLIAHPGQALSTALVYQAFDQMAPPPISSEALPAVERAVVRGEIPFGLSNWLEPAAHRVAPGLRDFCQALADWSEGLAWSLSGSGASYYILIADEDKARWLFESIRQRTPRVWIGRVMPERPAMK